MKSTFLLAVALGVLAAMPASAAAVRTFVSGKGADTNACSLVAPCRTFAGALAQTSSGGEIVVLDSAGYGAVTIDKSVTISNQTGVEGGISVNTGDAITINFATQATVTLKGLTLDGGQTATQGINVAPTASRGAVNVVNCTVRNFAGDGLRSAYAFTGGVISLHIADSTFMGNGANGILIQPQNVGTIQAVITRTIAIQNAGAGIKLSGADNGSLVATLKEVDATQNLPFGVGLQAEGPNNGRSFQVTVLHSVFRNNFTDVNSSNLSSGGFLNLFDRNYIGFLSIGTGAITYTDGSNDIWSVSPIANQPTPKNPQ